jgi:hypothetical protein
MLSIDGEEQVQSSINCMDQDNTFIGQQINYVQWKKVNLWNCYFWIKSCSIVDTDTLFQSNNVDVASRLKIILLQRTRVI